MTFAHTAALALVGWYLMLPPVEGMGRLNINLDAPFSSWRTYKSLASEKLCDGERDALLERADKLMRDPDNKRYFDLVTGNVTPMPRHDNDADVLNARGLFAALHVKCVSSDDPRLKHN
jgi:hypothetical protein